MGCNFYTMNGVHIGKRSAAGKYCFNCDITLCKDGVEKIHYCESKWYEKCPLCGMSPEKESLKESSVGRELGFNKIPQITIGVRSCSSFTWSKNPEILKNKRKIKNEYGDIYDIKVFKKMLQSYPIHYYHSIGVEFS